MKTLQYNIEINNLKLIRQENMRSKWNRKIIGNKLTMTNKNRVNQ